jgi:hypothetical protein
LWDLTVDPRLLDFRAGGRRADRLDGDDLRFANAVDGGDAGTDGDAIHMHRAGAAQRHAAAEFGAGHAQHVAQYPEERRISVDIDVMHLAVDVDGEGHGMLLYSNPYCISAYDPSYGVHVQTSLIAASILPRGAFEYGQI